MIVQHGGKPGCKLEVIPCTLTKRINSTLKLIQGRFDPSLFNPQTKSFEEKDRCCNDADDNTDWAVLDGTDICELNGALKSLATAVNYLVDEPEIGSGSKVLNPSRTVSVSVAWII